MAGCWLFPDEKDKIFQELLFLLLVAVAATGHAQFVSGQTKKQDSAAAERDTCCSVLV